MKGDFKFILCISFFFLIVSAFLRSEMESFVISKKKVVAKKLSKNRLKENIGDEIKQTLNCCADLSAQIAKVQIDLSGIQKNLFEKVEKLIDNKSPFRRASMYEFKMANKKMHDAKKKLGAQVMVVEGISKQINANVCLKNSD